jgi:hypothetical protein
VSAETSRSCRGCASFTALALHTAQSLREEAMNLSVELDHFHDNHDCRRKRMAENEVATIDYCDHGYMHLHIGPLSLRLTPEATSGLLEAIGQALYSYAESARGKRRLCAPSSLITPTPKRGSA